MIRIVATALQAEVDADSASWRQRAADYTAELKLHGSFTQNNLNGKSAPDWSDIKSAFLRLQQDKCAYCERALETGHEFDIEHFRPKSRVTPWAGPPAPPNNGRAAGYYWLAFDLENYCVACKPCNSGLKADHFPVLSTPGQPHDTVATLNTAEQPLLLFPFGSADADPEAVIGWSGITPIPKDPPGTINYHRAETTIAFFELDSRELLERERASQLLGLWYFLKDELDMAKSVNEQDAARRKVDRMLNNRKLPMRACLRAFAVSARSQGVPQELIESLEQMIAPPP
jgi:hypothetical protein